jgi:type I restriction enzyme S subunit
MRQIRLPLPPLTTQRRIAGILSAYDELIENNQRRIRILEDMARSLYREWFVHFRYPGHESAPLVDSPLGQIPQEWEVRKIAELLAKVSRQGKIKTQDYLQAGELPVIDQGRELVGGYTNDADVEYSGELPVILFGDHTRILKFIDFPFACGADGTQLLRSNDVRMPVSLFYYTLSAIELSDFAYARHFKFLKEELVVVPIAEIATAFSERVDPIKRQVRVLQQQSDNLRRTRDLLLPRLLSGQVELTPEKEYMQ